MTDERKHYNQAARAGIVITGGILAARSAINTVHILSTGTRKTIGRTALLAGIAGGASYVGGAMVHHAVRNMSNSPSSPSHDIDYNGVRPKGNPLSNKR